MTTTLSETVVHPSKPPQSKLPDASHLEDRMPEWLKASRQVFVVTAALGVVFCVLNYRTLWHTDLWGHLAYGRLIWQAGSIPTTEPLMPLASGMPFVDTAWLCQLIGYAAVSAYGTAALQALYAASITFCLGLLLWRFEARTKRLGLSLLGCALFAWVNWQQLIVVRPQLAGLVCFIGVLVALTSRRWHWANWIILPALFVLWANLHGSVVVGLALIGCFFVGRGIDVFRRTRRIAAVVRDRWVRRYFLLGELAAVAVLLNPYGLGLYAEVLKFSQNPNLADLLEWEPLTLPSSQGQAAFAVAMMLALLYRLSPRRVGTAEVLLLVGFGAAALWTSRMIVWWAPVAAWLAVLHGDAVWSRWRPRSRESAPPQRSGKWAVASIGVVWICFAYTPLGITLLHGSQEAERGSVSAFTPVAAVEYLNEHPPAGQVFNSYEWGDYLLWAGPPGSQVFVASHAHLVPTEVWRDYMRVIEVGSGWDVTLDRYGVNTMILDQARRSVLIEQLRDDAKWETEYEDAVAVVFRRR